MFDLTPQCPKGMGVVIASFLPTKLGTVQASLDPHPRKIDSSSYFDVRSSLSIEWDLHMIDTINAVVKQAYISVTMPKRNGTYTT